MVPLFTGVTADHLCSFRHLASAVQDVWVKVDVHKLSIAGVDYRCLNRNIQFLINSRCHLAGFRIRIIRRFNFSGGLLDNLLLRLSSSSLAVDTLVSILSLRFFMARISSFGSVLAVVGVFVNKIIHILGLYNNQINVSLLIRNRNQLTFLCSFRSLVSIQVVLERVIAIAQRRVKR